MIYPKDKIKEVYRSVPETLTDIIESNDFLNSLSSISKENGLNLDQQNALGNELVMQIIGLIKKEDLTTELQSKLLVDETLSKKITSDLESLILSKIPEDELGAQQKTAQEILSHPSTSEETLKSIPEQKPETQEIAPRVVVEVTQNKPSINLVQAPVVVKPLDLLPIKPANIIEEKLNQVVATPKQVTAYSGGLDPYREPTN